MVYSGTFSEINKILWETDFSLPYLSTHMRVVQEGTYMTDIDIGYIFLNFITHENLIIFLGVYFTHMRSYDMSLEVWDSGRYSN